MSNNMSNKPYIFDKRVVKAVLKKYGIIFGSCVPILILINILLNNAGAHFITGVMIDCVILIGGVFLYNFIEKKISEKKSEKERDRQLQEKLKQKQERRKKLDAENDAQNLKDN